jgi:predicted RNA-binding protein with PIN domain
MRRQFGDLTTTLYRAPENRPAEEKLTIRPPRQQYLIVDGYNIIFAWDRLAETAKHDLDAARRGLCDALSSDAGFKKCRLVLVFDGYKQKGSPGSKTVWNNIRIVYTPEGQTADAYIEALAAEIGTNYTVRVATSDGLVQLSSLRSGVLRVSARELREEILRAEEEMKLHYSK